MIVSQADPERRVPQERDESMVLARGITLLDARLFAPGIIVAMFSAVFGRALADAIGITPLVFIVPGAVIGAVLLILGIVVYVTTPDHYTSWEWLKLHAGHRARPETYEHITEQYDHAQREQRDVPEHDFLASAFATSQRTQDLLDIDQIGPGRDGVDELDSDAGFIERTDGTLIGAVYVEPANLSLATSREWHNAAGALTSMVNTVDFKTQIYRTTRELDIEHFLSAYQARQGDEDVRSEPVLERLLDEFLEWYPAQLQRRGTKIIEYYVIVEVPEEAVKTTRRTEGLTDQLADLPVFSWVFSDEDEEDRPEEVTRARQREKLNERLDDIKWKAQDIANDIDPEVVDATDHAEVIQRAYRANPTVEDGSVPTRGVVMADPERPDSDEETTASTASQTDPEAQDEPADQPKQEGLA